MAKQNIKIVASDLDGTLLQNGAQALPPETCDLILQLKELGVLFVAASGRPYTSLRRLFSGVQDEIAYIAENGALCIYQDKTLTKGIISKDLGDKVIDCIHAYSDGQCMVSGERISYTDSKNEAFIHLVQHEIGYDLQVVENLKTDVKEPYLKVSGYALSGSKKLELFLKNRLTTQAKIVTSGHVWIDCIADGYNKGRGLEILLREVGLSPENCMSFGDQYNDVEMLQLTKVSYAMSNAAPGIAYYSTDITDSVINELKDLIAKKKLEEHHP